METVSSHGTGSVTTSAKFFRDEKSRTRVEHGDMVSIDDPVKGESYILNMPQKLAIPGAPKPAAPAMPAAPALPGMPKPPAAPGAPKPPQMQEIADLGEKTINGFKTQGKRYAMPPAPAMPGAPQMPRGTEDARRTAYLERPPCRQHPRYRVLRECRPCQRHPRRQACRKGQPAKSGPRRN